MSFNKKMVTHRQQMLPSAQAFYNPFISWLHNAFGKYHKYLRMRKSIFRPSTLVKTVFVRGATQLGTHNSVATGSGFVSNKNPTKSITPYDIIILHWFRQANRCTVMMRWLELLP